MSKNNLLILIAALGYFVDAYDVMLFSIIRESSLKDLGFSGDALTNVGIDLQNWQLGGMMLGGLLWGVLGDKKGRVSVLFGSIILYSIANIANAFVTGYWDYAILRFVAGIGLAGELGAGITLVAESMSKEKRGYGTMIIVSVGALGVITASQVGTLLGWKTAYLVGGGMGLALLALRAGAFESKMFESIAQTASNKGNFRYIFQNKERAIRYLACIAVGIPVWFMIGILMTFALQFAKILGTEGLVIGQVVTWTYVGLVVGDLGSGTLSQLVKSRKKIMQLFLIFLTILVGIYLFISNKSATSFYALMFALGVAAGYWALFVTNSAEQFGTNLRSTVSGTVPNFVRGMVVPVSLGFKALFPSIGMVNAAVIMGIPCFLVAFWALSVLKEPYGKDLDYVE